MHYLKYICLFLYILVYGTEMLLAKPLVSDETSPFFFIHLSDPQLGFTDNNKSLVTEVEAMKKVVALVNRLKPPFIVITGDFVNNSRSEEQISAYKQLLGCLNKSILVFMVPGNHDIDACTSERIQAYRKNYRNTTFSFRYGECAFIGIDTNVIKNNDADLEAKQFKWLEQELKASQNASFRFVFGHCPIVCNDTCETVGYSNFSLEMRRKYLNLLQKYKVNAFFSGHLHDNAYCKVGNLELITIGSIGKALGKGYSGMNLVKVFSDRYESQYISLDEFPQYIRLPR